MARKTDTPASYHESWKAWSGTGTPRLHGEVTGKWWIVTVRICCVMYLTVVGVDGSLEERRFRV
ncbi:hypothetical protein ILYODFUR_036553, partial [Ilyodon furcidens]